MFRRADDILPEENDVVQLALKRLPPKEAYDRVFRIRRAFQVPPTRSTHVSGCLLNAVVLCVPSAPAQDRVDQARGGKAYDTKHPEPR